MSEEPEHSRVRTVLDDVAEANTARTMERLARKVPIDTDPRIENSGKPLRIRGMIEGGELVLPGEKRAMKLTDSRPPIRIVAEHALMDYSMRSLKDLWQFMDWDAVDAIDPETPMRDLSEMLSTIIHAASRRYDEWSREQPDA